MYSNEQPTALDVAEMILQERGPTRGLKLQKLVYYSQAWSMAERGSPLFSEQVQAWVHGPVVCELWQMHPGRGVRTTSVGGRPERLNEADRGLVREVLHYYGDKSGHELRQLTHDEGPWKWARNGLAENQPSSEVITQEAMQQFYQDRPWGGGEPVRDLSIFSVDRVEKARQEIADGDTVGLDDLARAVSDSDS